MSLDWYIPPTNPHSSDGKPQHRSSRTIGWPFNAHYHDRPPRSCYSYPIGSCPRQPNFSDSELQNSVGDYRNHNFRPVNETLIVSNSTGLPSRRASETKDGSASRPGPRFCGGCRRHRYNPLPTRDGRSNRTDGKSDLGPRGQFNSRLTVAFPFHIEHKSTNSRSSSDGAARKMVLALDDEGSPN